MSKYEDLPTGFTTQFTHSDEHHDINRSWAKTESQRDEAILAIVETVKNKLAAMSNMAPLEYLYWRELLIKREMLLRSFLFNDAFVGNFCITENIPNTDWIIEGENGKTISVISAIGNCLEFPVLIGRKKCYIPVHISNMNAIDNAAYRHIVALVEKGGTHE